MISIHIHIETKPPWYKIEFSITHALKPTQTKNTVSVREWKLYIAQRAYFSGEQSFPRSGPLMSLCEVAVAAQPVSLIEVFRGRQVSIPSAKPSEAEKRKKQRQLEIGETNEVGTFPISLWFLKSFFSYRCSQLLGSSHTWPNSIL